MEEIIAKAKDFIRIAFLETDKAHDYLHSTRVYENARDINNYDNVNSEVVLLSALLHDVGNKKLDLLRN